MFGRPSVKVGARQDDPSSDGGFGVPKGGLSPDLQIYNPELKPETDLAGEFQIPLIRLTDEVLDWLANKEAIRKDWRKKAHLHLDFSSVAETPKGKAQKVFDLKCFQPLGFYWGSGKPVEGLEDKPVLPVQSLETLVLDGNSLTDDAFEFKYQYSGSLSGVLFKNLRVLRMKGNQLTYPMMLLPRLRELNLSGNKIYRFPIMAGLPSLEDLNLSCNHIAMLDKERFIVGGVGNFPKQLRKLNLQANRIELKPTDLYEILKHLQDLPVLVHVILKENPFCGYFGEYQSLIVKCLAELEHVDDISLQEHAGREATMGVRKQMIRAATEFFGHQILHIRAGHVEAEKVDSFAQLDGWPEAEIQEIFEKIDVMLPKGKDNSKEIKRHLMLDRMKALDVEVCTGSNSRKELRVRKLGASHEQRQTNFRKNDAPKTDAPMPKLQDIMKEFDEALAGHSNVATSVKLAFELASRLTAGSTDRFEAMFDDTTGKRQVGRVDQKKAEAHKSEMVVQFVQQIELLYERNEDSRMLLVRTLAKFAPVNVHSFGQHCLLTLGSFAKSGRSGMTQVMDVVREMILPQILEKEIADSSCSCVVEGLAKLVSKETTEALAEILEQQEYISRLLYFADKMFKSTSMQGDSDPANPSRGALTVLLCCAANSKDGSARILESNDMVVNIAFEQILGKDSRLKSPHTFELYLNLIDILRNCIKHHADRTIKMLKNPTFSKENKGANVEGMADLHMKLIERITSAFEVISKDKSVRIFKEDLSLACCKKVGAVIDLLTDMMQDAECKRDLGAGDKRRARDNKIVAMVACIFEGDSADPILLASLTNCLRTLFQDDKKDQEMRTRYLGSITQILHLDSQTDNQLLPYIDDRKFKELYKRCERHLMQTENQDGDMVFSQIQSAVPEVKSCTNIYAHKAIIAIIKFVNMFSVLAAADPKCDTITNALNEAGRERLLFKLLEVPNEDVQQAIVIALGNTEIEELDDDEIEQLIKLLDPESASHNEMLLIRVLQRLQSMLEKKGEAADSFKSKYSSDVIRRTFAIILENSKRATYGNLLEEKQKVDLSIQGVALLLACSSDNILRRHLRQQDVIGDLCSMMKNEEQKVNYFCEDICIELSWTGRDVEKLLQLVSSRVLRNDRKQSFRIVNRMADVLVGIADPVNEPPAAAEARAKLESKMWSKSKLQWASGFLDDSVYEDRKHQQSSFSAFRGFARLLHFIERKADDAPQDDQEGQAAVADSLRFHEQAEEFITSLVTMAKKLEEDRKTKEEEAKADEEDKVIRLVEDPLSQPRKLEELLRDKFMQHGWQTRDALAGATSMVSPLILQQEFFFLPGTDGRIGKAYLVAATLRCMYALAVVPAAETTRQDLLLPMRSPQTLQRMIRLVEMCESLVDCHVGAKLLSLMSETLHVGPGESSCFGRSYLTALFHAAAFAKRCLLLIAPRLESACGAHALTLHQQILCLEAVRCIRLVCTALSRLDLSYEAEEWSDPINHLEYHESIVDALGRQPRPDDVLSTATGRKITFKELEIKAIASTWQLELQTIFPIRVQKVCLLSDTVWTCREAALEFAVPLSAVRCVFLCLLYDMQVSVGSQHGQSITDKYVRSVLERQGLREICSEILAMLLDSCKNMRYDILELFSTFEVRGKHHLRESYLCELMNRVHMHKYTVAMEKMFQARRPDERILQSVNVELIGRDCRAANSGLPPRILLVTNQRLLVMARPKHKLISLSHKCGICPPESFCPIGPEIEKGGEYAYKDITRIIIGPDPQYFVLCFRTHGKVPGETWEHFVCHKSDQRKALMEAIRQLSGLGYCEAQVQISQDEVIPAALGYKMRGRGNKVCLSYAVEEADETIPELTPEDHEKEIPGVANMPMHREGRLGLFIMTETEVVEFQVRFEDWIVPNIEFPVMTGREDFLHLNPDEVENPEEDPLAKLRKQRRAKIKQKTEADDWLASPREDKGQNEAFQSRGLLRLRDLSHRGKEVMKERERAKDGTRNAEADKSDEPGKSAGLEGAINKARHTILELKFRASLTDLTAVSYFHGDVPFMKLTFKSGSDNTPHPILIRFLDDTAREHWKRGLAYALSKSETGTQWNRKWKHPHGDSESEDETFEGEPAQRPKTGS